MALPLTMRPDAYDRPFDVVVNGSSVMLTGIDAVAVSLTPEAILACLKPMRAAAQQALKNRGLGMGPNVEGDPAD